MRPPLEFRRIQAANLTNWNGDQADTEYVKLVTRIAEILGESAPVGQFVEPVQPEEEFMFVELAESVDVSDAPPAGIIVDSRAVQAMADGANLYPVGVLDVVGNFRVGADIALYDDRGEYVGEGTAAYSSEEIRRK